MLSQSHLPSIRHMLLFAFMLAGLLPTILIASLAYQQTRNALKLEIEHDMQARARATVDEIDRMMFERLQNVASWSRLEIMQDSRIGDVDKRLSLFLQELSTSYQGVYSEIQVQDMQGKVIASSNPLSIGKQQAALGVWRQLHFAASELKLAPLTGNVNKQLPVITDLYLPQQAQPFARLVAVFNWQQVQQVLQESAGEKDAVALFDTDQKLLASTAQWASMQASDSIQQQAVGTGMSAFAGFHWQLVISERRADAYAPIHRMAWIFSLLLFTTIALACAIALPVARAITEPLGRLTAFANRFIAAPTHHTPPTGGPQEIRVMAAAFARMIADLETSKENLTRAAKLAVVGEMAAAMSHEVRTPLGILRSSAQILQREPTLSDEGREVCTYIVSETERLNRLVSTLIDAAKPRLPVLKINNITQLVQHVLSMLKVQAEQKNIQLVCTSVDAHNIECDAEQIMQVLLNLVLNAIQILPATNSTTPDHGPDHVSGRVEISLHSDGSYIELTVADNGPGIALEHQAQIFDPFFTQRKGGVGLGLSVVRQIVQAHQGDIQVQTSVLGGAAFVIRLPYRHSVAEQQV
jgi:two-component system, NtrC family, sensor histidine kinase HydH